MKAIAAGREADREARRAAQSQFTRPLVIEAGAGTGKTTTLVARALAWSLGPGWERAREAVSGAAGEPPADDRIAARTLSGIVAITFTEAAAAEMAGRVAQGLAMIAGSAERAGSADIAEENDDALPAGLDPLLLPPPAERLRRACALVGTLDHLAVRTIHAFCRGLLATFPLEAGLHPNLTVDADGRILEATVREAVESSLRDAYGDPGDPDFLALAARGYGPPEILEALMVLAGEGLPAAALAGDPFAPEGLAAFNRRLAAAAAALHRPLAARLGAGAAGRRQNAHFVASGLAVLIARLEAEALNLADLPRLRGWLAEALPGRLADHVKKWGKGKLTSKAERELLGEVGDEIAAAAGALCRLLDHVARLDPELLSHARRALAPLLARVERELRARGAATFNALLAGTAALLTRHPEVRARVRRGIDQLLVDEFQDTDRLQCEILRLLALDGPPDDRPGLFLVGDPKQSIYGWRSADLAAYDGFVAQVVAAGGEVRSLAENFRSVPAILAEVSRVMASAMRERAGLQPRFEPLLPCEERSADAGFVRPGSAGGRPRHPVEHWVSWKMEGDASSSGPRTRPGEAAELEAAALAADLRDLHAEHGVAWKEIGVLLRSLGYLETYLEALRREGIPFRVGRDRQYYRRREVIETAALVRAVLDPGDHLALLTVLRSPLVGVPDAALVPLWRHRLPRLLTELSRPRAASLDRLRRVIAEAAREVPADIPGLDRIRGWEAGLVAAVEQLAVLRASWAADPADLFVERLRGLFLVEPLAAARYLGAYRLANLERFFRQLSAALEEGGGDVSATLRRLRLGVALGLDAEEGRPDDAAEDSVSVLTIHGAKGLDFPHVYLLQVHTRPPPEQPGTTEVGPLPLPAAAASGAGAPVAFEYRLFGAATLGYDEVEAQRAQVEAAERVRTLYVAMTRARDRLVLAGVWPQRDGAPEPEQARTHIELLLARPEVPVLAELFAAAAREGTCSALDASGALWYLPDLDRRRTAPAAASESDDGGALLPGIEEVRRDAALLAVHRRDAEARMSRRFSAAASEEAHESLRELMAERRQSAEGEAGTGAVDRAAGMDRDVALAAGGAVHRALESWDLAAEPAAELDRQSGLLSAYLAMLTEEGENGRGAAAGARAQSLLASFAAGPLLPRLRALAGRIVARELPVLLPPGEGEEAPVGFVAGAVDLLYRDPETAALVVADYKTDDVAVGPDLAARAAAYATQGAAYVRAVQEALRLATPPRFELWFLSVGQVVEVAR